MARKPMPLQAVVKQWARAQDAKARRKRRKAKATKRAKPYKRSRIRP